MAKATVVPAVSSTNLGSSMGERIARTTEGSDKAQRNSSRVLTKKGGAAPNNKYSAWSATFGLRMLLLVASFFGRFPLLIGLSACYATRALALKGNHALASLPHPC